MALFGFPSQKKEPVAAMSSTSDDIVFDVGTADFEERAIKASMQKPVLVDFWAPWCGPCKQLMPVLEAEVRSAGGDVLLAKVNIDDNPELAQALRIQSVPTVMAFFQGQPVTAFSGARPASDIKNLIAQLVKLARSAMPDALDIPQALKAASESLTLGDLQAAQNLYLQILQQDPAQIDAFTGMVRVLVAAGALDEAKDFIESAPDVITKNAGFAATRTILDIAVEAGKKAGSLRPLEQKLDQYPDDLQARFDLAQAQFAASQKQQSIDNLLEVIRRDRAWNEEAGRKELLRYFEALGFNDPLAVDGRKKLSRLLFS